jgi:hypothetical protein
MFASRSLSRVPLAGLAVVVKCNDLQNVLDHNILRVAVEDEVLRLALVGERFRALWFTGSRISMNA